MTAETRRRVRIEIRAAELAAQWIAAGESFYSAGLPYAVERGWLAHYHCLHNSGHVRRAELSTADHEVGYLARQIIYGDES